MTFFFLALVFMWIGGKLGWVLSRAVLYITPVAAIVALSLVWELPSLRRCAPC